MFPTDAPTSTLTSVPDLTGPLPADQVSYPFSAASHQVQALDLGDFGYVEEEFFASGAANVYEEGTDGTPLVAESEIPYTNRLLVRRPANPGAASGTVWVDIMNASNGFDVEDHWRRAWNHWMTEGDTYIGVTSKPIQIDALKNFDPVRYAPLTWDLPGSAERRPLIAVEGAWDPMQELPGTEEGLVWDILTQVGGLLRSDRVTELIAIKPERIFLIGQSQSAVYLNTWIAGFHAATSAAHGRTLFDGYLATVGADIRRPLRQGGNRPAGIFATVAADNVELDVPHITLTAEGDLELFRGMKRTGLVQAGSLDGPLRRHWQVAGTPHTDLRSGQLPRPEDIRRSGRIPRVMDRDFLDQLNIIPLEPAVLAAMTALVRWVAEGVPAAPSIYLHVTDDGRVERDGFGNALGGIRSGLLEYPLGSFQGAADGGAVYGTQQLLSEDKVRERFPDAQSYLSAVREQNRALQEAGYLTELGAQRILEVAAELWDRIHTAG